MPPGSVAALRPRRFHARLALLLLVGFLGSCDAAPPPGASETGPDRIVGDPTPTEAPDTLPTDADARVREIGAPAAAALAEGLLTRLGEAIDERGAAGAVEFCSLEAIPLTREIESAQGPAVRLKRTTTRWRNPDNAPDEAEAGVLRYLESLEAAAPGSAPDLVTGEGPDGSFRLYRTLRTGPVCLQCHGAEADLAPEVREILAARYPEDRAIGYEAGELRGVIRVEIPGNAVAP